jgi:hypothetical protein
MFICKSNSGAIAKVIRVRIIVKKFGQSIKDQNSAGKKITSHNV